MKQFEDTEIVERKLMAATFFYAVVMLAAFGIGLYGLFSLFWLALSAAERNLQAVGLIF